MSTTKSVINLIMLAGPTGADQKEDVIKPLVDVGYDKEDVLHAIDELRTAGVIYEPSNGCLKMVEQ